MAGLQFRHIGKGVRWLGTVPAQSASTGQAFTLNLDTLSVAPAAQTRVYTVFAGALPTGLAIVGNSITGTPTVPGAYSATLRVIDGSGGEPRLITVAFTIGSSDLPPEWTSTPAPTFIIGQPTTYQLPVIDQNGDPITTVFDPTAATPPAGTSLDSSNRIVWSGSGVAGATPNCKVIATSGPVDAESDWQARKAWVLARGGFAYGMDTSLEVTSKYIPGAFGTRGFFDSVRKIGAGGSLRLELRGGEANPQLTGRWTTDNPPFLLGNGFGEGETLVMQYRCWLSDTMQSNFSSWDSEWKNIILHQGSTACSSFDFVVRPPQFGFDSVYSDCGSAHCFTDPASPIWKETVPYLYNQDWANTLGPPPYTREPGGLMLLRDGSGGHGNPWNFPTSKWVTIELRIKGGTFWQNPNPAQARDTSFEMWTSDESTPVRRKVISWALELVNNVAHTDRMNNFSLTAFMTGLTQAASQTATVNYDQVLAYIGTTGELIPFPSPYV